MQTSARNIHVTEIKLYRVCYGFRIDIKNIFSLAEQPVTEKLKFILRSEKKIMKLKKRSMQVLV
jgi:hypothetical protein